LRLFGDALRAAAAAILSDPIEHRLIQMKTNFKIRAGE
jgi:hypothetical protein